eukprot:gb/GECH01004959.1/.p1 GENE.gb/GECH01004959.1/~~gb/GECH01004959.1/.p1  ORF type:complete len:250 (+),score=54.66 gb/GECH01004959.1/:1-750(+)
MISNALSALWKGYNRALSRFPVTTKSTLSGSLFVGGDLVSQYVENQKEPQTRINGDRALQMGLFGTLVNGPVMHLWFRQLDRLVPGTGTPSLIRKISLDQMVFAPLFYGVFFACTAVMKDTVSIPRDREYHHPHHQNNNNDLYNNQSSSSSIHHHYRNIVSQLSVSFLPTMIMDWQVWPAANLVNFALIPQQHRVLYSNVVSLVWNAYLSSMAHDTPSSSSSSSLSSYPRTVSSSPPPIVRTKSGTQHP